MPKSAIIHRSELGWQAQLREAFRSSGELAEFLHLDQDSLASVDSHPDWPLRVPLAFAQRMQKNNIDDPLLRQVLPLKAENQAIDGFINDPLQEARATPQPGIVHKYHGRALLVATGSCAIHCRYCFRREFDYKQHQMGPTERQKALRYFADNPDISELIFSGGDPLMLNDEVFLDFCHEIEKIKSIQRLRIHTRLPVVIPARLETTFIERLAGLSMAVVLVVHINHANEIDASLAQKLMLCRQAGITVLNQAVLLAGVNDSVEALSRLSLTLFDAGVLPYYLHLPDPVTGTAHFFVDEARGRHLLGAITQQLPGYLVPKLVREEAGLGAKQTILADL